MEPLKLEDVQHFLKSQKRHLRKLILTAPSESERSMVKTSAESSRLSVFRAYLVSSSRDEIVAAGFYANDLEKKVVEAKTEKEAMAFVSEFQKRAKAAEEKFQEDLTDEIIKSHPDYVVFEKELEELYEELDFILQQQSQPSQPTTSQKNSKNPKPKTGTKEFVPTTDPVTKTPLIDPIKNSICNHFYGKASILEIIRKNRKARCPYAGCPNKNYLRKEQFIRDEEMEKKIAEKIQQEAEGEDEESVTGGRKSLNCLDESM